VTLQENVLIDAISPVENLRVFGRYHLLREPALSRRIEEVLDFLELRSHASVPVKTLSGGFRRPAGRRALVMNRPELLVLDEPTTGLDPAVRLALWSRVRALQARGTTVLLTTHYMDEAQRLCDRVAIIAGGRVVADASPEVLIRRHLAAEAVEVDCTREEETRLVGTLRPRAQLRVGGRVILYADDAAALVAEIRRCTGTIGGSWSGRRTWKTSSSRSPGRASRDHDGLLAPRARGLAAERHDGIGVRGGSTSCRTSSSRSSTWCRSGWASAPT
jgi:lipooligosaccharide transport system ATP-binding protein